MSQKFLWSQDQNGDRVSAATLNLPRFNGWMIPDDALELVCDLIRDRKPESIVEAGSGRSTVVIADVLSRIGDGMIVSLEHQPDFALATRGWLAENSLQEFADVRYAPLVDGWYDLHALDGIGKIEMLLVDGPPGHLSERARQPALELLMTRLAPGAVVLLDDTHRPQEREIIASWRKLVPDWSPVQVTHSTGALSYGIMP